MAAHQAPPSLGFSRQEHWSGLPFPSPMHESEVAQSFSRVQLLATPWAAAYQAPLSMGFSRQEYRSGVPLPSLKIKYYASTNMQLLLLELQPHSTSMNLFLLIKKNFGMVCGILATSSGIEPASPAVEVLSTNHWTAWEVSCQRILKILGEKNKSRRLHTVGYYFYKTQK